MSVHLCNRTQFYYGIPDRIEIPPEGVELVPFERGFLKAYLHGDDRIFYALVDGDRVTALAPIVGGLADLENKIIL